MAEITEIINAKLEDFKYHTENLLGLVKELDEIKKESKKIQSQIQEKIKEIENYEKLINNLKEEADHIIQDIKSFVLSVSKEMYKTLEALHSLEQRITNLQERTDGFFEGIEKDVKEFKEEIKNEIDSRMDTGLKTIKEYTEETRTIISREITEFLNKQNVLIANLTQQIDSCQRAINTFKIDLEKNSQAIREIEKEIGTLKEEAKNRKESEAQLKHEIDELRSSNHSMAKELRGLKSKFADTEFIKKFGIGYILAKKKGD